MQEKKTDENAHNSSNLFMAFLTLQQCIVIVSLKKYYRSLFDISSTFPTCNSLVVLPYEATPALTSDSI
jgi:hypothetical protein